MDVLSRASHGIGDGYIFRGPFDLTIQGRSRLKTPNVCVNQGKIQAAQCIDSTVSCLKFLDLNVKFKVLTASTPLSRYPGCVCQNSGCSAYRLHQLH
jgi:hypothetical protein